jgi:putative transposase
MADTKRAYKFRFYPTNEQTRNLAQTFGCVRVVYNWALNKRKRAYFDEGKKLSFKDLCADLPQLKKTPEYVWLKDVSAVPLQQALHHLDDAYKRFFKHLGGYPTFKNGTMRSLQPTRVTPSSMWPVG